MNPIKLQVIPQAGHDSYALVRNKVTHEAQTWSWTNKAKTRLRHSQKPKGGYIEVASADGVLVAQIYAEDSDAYFLAEKFVGRLIAWFPNEIAAINLQILSLPPKRRSK